MSERKRIRVALTRELSSKSLARLRRQPGIQLVKYVAGHTPSHEGSGAADASEPAPKNGCVWGNARADVVLGFPQCLSAHCTASVHGIKWVQALSAGVLDELHISGIGTDVLSDVIVTSASGIHAIPLAEHVLLGLLSLVRGSQRIRDSALLRSWQPMEFEELHGRKMLIVGYGSIGSEVATRALAFGMKVSAVRRNCRSPIVVDGVRTFPMGELLRLVSETDVLVLCLPLTEETRNIVSADVLGLLPDHALVVNVGRGQTLDEEALRRGLESGRIGGAILDVTQNEPLAADHAFWTMPNVILTPHTAGLSVKHEWRLVNLFVDNLRRYVNGQALMNVIDLQRGY